MSDNSKRCYEYLSDLTPKENEIWKQFQIRQNDNCTVMCLEDISTYELFLQLEKIEKLRSVIEKVKNIKNKRK